MMKNVLFVIDKIGNLNWKRDSSIFFAYNAEIYGNKIYFCYKEDIFLDQNKTFCYATEFSIESNRLEERQYVHKGQTKWSLNDFQMIFIRLNPPFDITYLTVTHFLRFVDQSKTLIVNDPKVFQITSEKLLALHFPQFIPETTISSDFNIINQFFDQFDSMVLKPLYSFGSDDVFLINKNDCNFKLIFDSLLSKYNGCPVIAQRFLKNVKNGDKRILILDDQIIGSFLRIPRDHSILSGTVHGSKVVLSELSEKESQIAEEVTKYMKENRIYFAGVDVIDGYLTEINFTSPTGLPILVELTKIDCGQRVWEIIENTYQREITDYKL